MNPQNIQPSAAACNAAAALASRDVALSFSWKTDSLAWLAQAGLPERPTRPLDLAAAAIALQAGLIGAAEPNRRISHSRSRSFYDGARRYNGTAFGFHTVPPAVDLLAQRGLLNVAKVRPGNRGLQSTHWATPALVALTAPAIVTARAEPLELIRLKDGKGPAARLIDYRDTERTCRMRREMCANNEARGSLAIDWPGAERVGAALCKGGAVFYPGANQYCRIFARGCFSMGGRLYGDGVQNLPAASRAELTINGAPVAETDFKQIHVQLAYLWAGLPALADGFERAERGSPADGYYVRGFDRDAVKIAFNVLLNTDSQYAAVLAIAKHLAGDAPTVDSAHRVSAQALVVALKRRHAPIGKLFHAGMGLRLQRVDSDLACRVLAILRKRGVAVAAIHDSFLSKASDQPAVAEAMEQARAELKSGLKP